MQDVVDAGAVSAKAHLSHLERGSVKPTLATLTRLAQCFDIALQDLLPPRPIDRAQLIERVGRLDDDQLRAIDGVLRLIERDGG
jgi:transcriptional regulator with XRE-family HTH domain